MNEWMQIRHNCLFFSIEGLQIQQKPWTRQFLLFWTDITRWERRATEASERFHLHVDTFIHINPLFSNSFCRLALIKMCQLQVSNGTHCTFGEMHLMSTSSPPCFPCFCCIFFADPHMVLSFQTVCFLGRVYGFQYFYWCFCSARRSSVHLLTRRHSAWMQL